jgi:hypothetical protein
MTVLRTPVIVLTWDGLVGGIPGTDGRQKGKRHR